MKYDQYMKWFYIFGILITIIVVFLAIRNKSTLKLKDIKIAGNELEVEVANNSASHTKGLMFRDSMPENRGMLFVFKTKGAHRIWMQNTYIPLDVVWVNNNMEIFHIEENVPPCKTVTCKTYGPKNPDAKYFIEMNAGWVEENGIKLGDMVEL